MVTLMIFIYYFTPPISGDHKLRFFFLVSTKFMPGLVKQAKASPEESFRATATSAQPTPG